MKNFTFLIAFLFLLISYNSNAQWNVTLGTGAGTSITSGDQNVVIGDSAGYNLTSGSMNTFIGYHAGWLIDDATNSASDNTVIGAFAMGGTRWGQNAYIGSTYPTYTGTDNVIIGKYAGYFNQATDNTFVGHEAGFKNTSGSDNTFIGEEAGQENTTGRDNTFVGEDSGYNNTDGDKNTFIGSTAGRTNTIGRRNTFVGNEAGYDNTVGYWNTFVGDSAGSDCGEGVKNTFIGQGSGAATEYTSNNTFIGFKAGGDNNRTNTNNLIQAQRNTYVGSLTGSICRTGSDNVGLGTFANFSGNAYSRCVFIGSGGQGYESAGWFTGYGMAGNNDVIVMGYKARNAGQYGIAIGNEAYIYSATGAIGIGYQTNIDANSDYGIGIGNLVDMNAARHSIAVGNQTIVNSDSAIAIGSFSTANHDYSIAIGTNALVDINNAMVIGGMTSYDRVSLGIGTTQPNQNASLDLAENNKGFLVSRMSTAEKTSFGGALGTTEEGMLVFDTDTNYLYVWDGAQWISNDQQAISLIANTLSITNNTSTVDLSAFLDNTDNQELALATNTLSISGGSNTIDLSAYLDNTDNQDLALSTNTLSISGGVTTIDLGPYLDNTDSQELDLTTNTLSISGGTNTIDLSTYLDNTDNQDLALSTNTLSISGGVTTIDLGAYLDNTDEQELSLTGDILSISGGTNTIDLSAYTADTDEQDLTGASLTGTVLQVDIENGASVSVDLAPMLDSIYTILTDHEARIVQLEADVAYLQSLHGMTVNNPFNPNTGAQLYQNIPNPANMGTTRIQFYIPQSINSASLTIYDASGATYKDVVITDRNLGFIDVNVGTLSSGIYFYSLIIDGQNAASKKMTITH